MSNLKQALIFVGLALLMGLIAMSASSTGYKDGYASGLGKGLEEHCGAR